MDYYERNSQKFIESTLNLDVGPLYASFKKYLKPGDKVLDLGCGPGRDLKYFSSKYQVIGLEPSPALSLYAKNYSGAQVIQSRIEDFRTTEKFNGIWACASLLHIPSRDLAEVFQKIEGLLTEEGVLFASFKYGDFEGIRNDRYFTNMTEESLSKVVNESSLNIKEMWVTRDLRETREDEKWLNIIAKRSP